MKKALDFIHNYTKILYIIRGPPGSGKSTLALKIKTKYPQALIISADNYRYKYDQATNQVVYVFHKEENHYFHSLCQQSALEAMKNSHSPLIIDNTNIKLNDFNPYLKIAKDYGYFIYIITPKTDWFNEVRQLTSKNIHGVPSEVIARMLTNYQTKKPKYFGWFLPTERNHLKYIAKVKCPGNLLSKSDLARKLLDIFANLEKQNLFKKFLKDNFKANSMKQVWSNITDAQIYDLSLHPAQNPIHVTSYFSDERYNEYLKRSVVNYALSNGRVDLLKIVGIYFSHKVIGLRIQFNEETQRSLPELWAVDDLEKTVCTRKETLESRHVGSRAHMTLAVSGTGKAVDCGIEQLRLNDLEHVLAKTKTILTCYGSLTCYEGQSLVYLDLKKPIRFIGQFGAYYFS